MKVQVKSQHLAVTAGKHSSLSHYGSKGEARMVDVSAKPTTYREAEARAFVALRPAVLAALASNPKGDALEVARIAGIAGAKRTADLIPLCHPLSLTRIEVEARRTRGGVRLTSRVGTTAATGVEMEALTAVSIAALTLYDMCKAMDHGIEIQFIQLTRKSGGRSGDFRRAGSATARRHP
ncbi:MAG: cyclic pyranopterin monophosphate synthase MoaC [Terriglobales bacterium]